MGKPCLEIDKQISGGLGHQYTIEFLYRRKENPSTPPASNTTYSRLERVKPEVYTAIDQDGKRVMVKAASYDGGRKTLFNEAKILSRLNWIGLHIAPHLISYIHQNGNIYYFIFERFDPEEWESLEHIIGIKKITITDPEQIRRLQKAINRSLHWLHFCGVIHGDFKDEHVLVRKKVKDPHSSDDYDFGNIHIIDFGFGTLKRTGKWQGASIGFSSPYFWDHSHHIVLSYKELLGEDWYGADALLYYSITGECFPTTSPSFSVLSSPRDNIVAHEYYQELIQSLILHHRHHGTELKQLIHDLAQPDSFEKANWYQSLITYLGTLINENRVWFVLCFLTIGLASNFLPGWMILSLAILFILISQLIKNWQIPRSKEDVNPININNIPKAAIIFGLLLIGAAFALTGISIRDHFLLFLGSIIALFGLLIGFLLSYFARGQPDALLLIVISIIGSLLPPFLALPIPIFCGWFVKLSGKFKLAIIPAMALNIFLMQLFILSNPISPFQNKINTPPWASNSLIVAITWLVGYVLAVLSSSKQNLNARIWLVLVCGLISSLLPYLITWKFIGPLNFETPVIIQIIITTLIIWITGILFVRIKQTE